MQRIVLNFIPSKNGAVLVLERAHLNVAGREEGLPIELPNLDGDARARGQALMALLLSHKPVELALSTALANPIDSAPLPLYFQVSGAADALPWEQIYSDGPGFCALDRRWPIGRITRSDSDLADRAFDPPLAMVALLSAAGRSGVDQLNTLVAVVESAAGMAIGVELRVISGQEDVRSAAEQAAATNPAITFEPIASDEASVLAQITAAKPQVLHVLSHGGMAAGVRVLNLATTADDDADLDIGSVNLKVPGLANALAPGNAWLVVLSACDTAEASEGPALARDLVGAGLPAVIGMRRPVVLGDTNRICAALYPELFAIVRAAVEVREVAARSVVDWAAALTTSRTAVGGPTPESIETWSDPVLYVHPSQLRVFRATAHSMSTLEFANLTAQLDEWRRFRSGFDVDAPQAVVADFDRKIAELEARLEAGMR